MKSSASLSRLALMNSSTWTPQGPQRAEITQPDVQDGDGEWHRRVQRSRYAQNLPDREGADNLRENAGTGRASDERLYNTFVLSGESWQFVQLGPGRSCERGDPFEDDYKIVEADYPDLLARDAQEAMTGKAVDLW